MSTSKRNRGRPLGTGKDDSKVLEAVAEIVAADPAIRATTAMHRVAPGANEADVRRFQAKWKERREELIMAAHARLEAKRQRATSRPTPSYQPASAWLSPEHLELLRAAVESPTARLAWEMSAVESATAKLARVFCESEIKRATDLAHSPAAELARQLVTSPAASLAGSVVNDATLRALHDVQSTLAVRATDAAVMKLLTGRG